MSYKSRGNWNIGWCGKAERCKNFEKKCEECYRFSEYKEKKNGQRRKVHQ